MGEIKKASLSHRLLSSNSKDKDGKEEDNEETGRRTKNKTNNYNGASLGIRLNTLF